MKKQEQQARRLAALKRVAADKQIDRSLANSMAKSGLVYVVQNRLAGLDGCKWQASTCILTAAGQKLLDEASKESK